MTARPPPTLPSWDELAARINKRPQRRVRMAGFRESAVLVPLLAGDGESSGEDGALGSAPPELLYIVRNAALSNHAGQIAFPGGKRESHDTTLIDTALREASEEVGIPADRVQILGTLDDVPTPMRFVITPVVGVVRGPVQLNLHPAEVAETFTAVVPGLPATHHIAGTAEWLGHPYVMHEFRYAERRIWGATAAITLQLLNLMALMRTPPRDPEAFR
jgi:8-oxo-dGTP pyrophosphatase MutT (NUDIX family)